MTYNQLLKKRRIDLNLSITDISMQTHLKPEYIRAIEENNLDLFSDDLSYVRYFVRGYCDAIGVNWDVIKPHVDQQVTAYAAARDQAMAKAQDQMIRQMSASRPTKQSARKSRKRRKRSFLQNSAGRVSRMLGLNPEHRLTKIILGVSAFVIAAVLVFSVWSDSAYEKAAAAAAEERVEQLKAKEEQTQQMADQLKDSKNAAVQAPRAALAIEADPASAGTYWVIGDLSANGEIAISISSAWSLTCTIYLNDQLVFTQSGKSMEYTVQNGSGCSFSMMFSALNSDLNITMNDTQVPLDISALNAQGITTLTFKTASSKEEAGLTDADAQEQSGLSEQTEDEYGQTWQEQEWDYTGYETEYTDEGWYE